MSATPGQHLPPPPGGDRDRGSSLNAMYWTECAISLVLVGLRFYARTSIRSLGVDDWLMLVTVVIFLIMTCFVTYLTSIGGGRHLQYLTPQKTLEALKWSIISQPWGIFIFATGKASVAVLILRIMGPTTFWRKWILYGVIISGFFFNSLGCIVDFLQCIPPRSRWTPGLPAKCWTANLEIFFIFISSWGILLDIILALLPVTIFWNLNMKLARRIALCCLLGLGLLDSVFSGIKMQYLIHGPTPMDFTWTSYNLQAWTGIEAFVMILCGNIPPLKPLWDRFVVHTLDSNYRQIPKSHANGGHRYALKALEGPVQTGNSVPLVSVRGAEVEEGWRVREEGEEWQMKAGISVEHRTKSMV